MSTPNTPTPPERAKDIAIRYDDLTLQRHAASYPEELREPFMWFGWFVREKCSGQLDILVDRAGRLGIDTDKTTWSKIFRGKYDQDGDGNKMTPCLALKKLLRYIEQFRETDRLADLAGKIPFVWTPTARTIEAFIDSKRALERVNKIGVVVGFTGSQKTASFKEYCRLHNHGTCVWMEMPENGSMKEFVVTLATKYGGARRDSYEGARSRVMETLMPKAGAVPRTIVVDNAQAGYRDKHGAEQPVFNFIRRMGDETGATFILSFTPEFHNKLRTEQGLQSYFEQFEGRAGGSRGFLVLPEYASEEDVQAIAESFKLRDVEKHLAELVKIARERGRIRRLFEDLQQAKIDAEADGKALTINYVRAARGEE